MDYKTFDKVTKEYFYGIKFKNIYDALCEMYTIFLQEIGQNLMYHIDKEFSNSKGYLY